MSGIQGRKIFAHLESRAGIVLGILLLGFLITGPHLTAFDPRATSLHIFGTPDKTYFFGTNDIGQDIFSRLLAGGRSSLIVALGVGLMTTFLSLSLGSWAGLAGGWTDKLIMRLIDILLVIPNIIIIIIVASYIRPTLVLEIFIISALGWLEGARMIRTQILTIKERTHIYAAKNFGAGRFYLFSKHLLPELFPLILVLFLQGVRRAVFIEAGLAFVGVVDPNVISWGSMISNALKYYYLEVWKWWLLPAAGMLSLSLLSLTLIGYGLEESQISRSKGEKGNAADS